MNLSSKITFTRLLPVLLGAAAVVLSPLHLHAGEGDNIWCGTSNPSFEIGPGLENNPVSGWTIQGNVIRSTAFVSHGTRSIALSGPFTGQTDFSRMYTRMECSSGWQHRIFVDALHTESNPILGNARIYFIAKWMNSSNEILATQYVTLINASTPTDVFQETNQLLDAAPNGTASLQIEIAFLQTANQEIGRAYVDNVRFTRTNPPNFQWGDFSGNNYLTFADRSWRVKSAYTGPGPNSFSPSNATVNAQGGMELSVSLIGGAWRCSEVVLEEALGYGTYQFKMTGRMDLMDPNLIFSPFLWEYPQCFDGGSQWWNPASEFDLEFSRWGDPNNQPAQFTAQPYDWPNNLSRFDIPSSSAAEQITGQLEWTPNAMICSAWLGHANEPSSSTLLHTWTYTGPHLPRPGQPRVHINFWLLNGEAPTNGQATTITVNEFIFTSNDIPCPGDLNADLVVDGADLGLLLGQWGGEGNADFNGSGEVDGADLGVMLGSWGLCPQ